MIDFEAVELTSIETRTLHAIIEVIIWSETGFQEGSTTSTSHDLLHKVTELLQSTADLLWIEVVWGGIKILAKPLWAEQTELL